MSTGHQNSDDCCTFDPGELSIGRPCYSSSPRAHTKTTQLSLLARGMEPLDERAEIEFGRTMSPEPFWRQYGGPADCRARSEARQLTIAGQRTMPIQ